MLELKRRGWTRGVMQRTLGMPHADWRKANGKEWIYPTEQVRYSRQLRKIISGELVLRQRTRKVKTHGKNLRGVKKQGGEAGEGITLGGVPVWDAVIADKPEPLRMPMKMSFDIRTGKVGMKPQYLPPENPLPNFKTVYNRITKKSWRV